MTNPETLAGAARAEFAAAAAAPPLETVSTGLIDYLRRVFKNRRIGYEEAPERLRGGTNCFIYRFRLSGVPTDLDETLILRLYPRHHGERRVVRETLFQNALAAQGYPAPRVHLCEEDPSALGGAFLVGQFLPGTPMPLTPAMPDMLARTHADLHAIDPEPVASAFREQGQGEESYALDRGIVDRLGRLADLPGRFRPVLDWMMAHHPSESGRPAVCHGDFHPFNILVRNGRVTGVLDWSDVVLADHEFDVARTMGLAIMAGRQIPSFPDPERVARRYLELYRKRRPVDPRRLDYYRIRLAVLALMNLGGGWAIWQTPEIAGDLAADIRRVTGIDVA